jgi:hypothetical protein
MRGLGDRERFSILVIRTGSFRIDEDQRRQRGYRCGALGKISRSFGTALSGGYDDLFQFLKSSVPGATGVEIAVEDQHYREVILHSDIVRVATIVVRDSALSLLLNLLASWIAKRIWPDVPTTSTPEVESSIVVIETEGTRTKSVQLFYKGPAAMFEATAKKAFESGGVSDSTESRPSNRSEAVH